MFPPASEKDDGVRLVRKSPKKRNQELETLNDMLLDPSTLLNRLTVIIIVAGNDMTPIGSGESWQRGCCVAEFFEIFVLSRVLTNGSGLFGSWSKSETLR